MPQFGLNYSGPARREHDHYVTELTLVEAALNTISPYFIEFIDMAFDEERAIRILDPCAGNDARWANYLKAAIKEELIKTYPSSVDELEIEVTALDIRETGNEEIIRADFLEYDFGETKFDFIVSNPPYGPKITYNDKRQPLAEAFVRKGYELLNGQDSIMMYLLNADFETGVDRYNNLWIECPLSHRYVCSRRPSFSNDGKTSGNNYALYLWIKDNIERVRSWQTTLLLHEREI